MVENMNNNLVLPGDKLSTSEELMPGDGTFEEGGIIGQQEWVSILSMKNTGEQQ